FRNRDSKRETGEQSQSSRLADIESKLSDIIGLLSRSDAPSDEDRNSTIPIELADIDIHIGTDPVGCINHENVTDISMIGALGAQETNFMQHAPEGTSRYSTNQDAAWSADQGLSPAVLQHLVTVFSGMSTYFPFVRVPNGLEVALLSEDRPFLYLAAVTIASSRFQHLQAALSERFKEILSRSLIVAEEKDLDLLQGLILHLAWYDVSLCSSIAIEARLTNRMFHFHFNPRSPQTYRYLQIAISMVVDLGIEELIIDMTDGDNELGDTYSREACRAYLGCYYISSVISTSSGKPNNLRISSNMLRAALVLQREREYDTDELIYHLLKQQQFVDEVCETYRFERQQSDRSRLCTHAERFATRLEDRWSSLSVELRRNGNMPQFSNYTASSTNRLRALLLNSYHAAKIRIFEMGLVYNYGQPRRHPKNAEDSTILSASPMLISNLIRCVESTKAYLDFFFTIPEMEYHKLSFSIWYQVVLAVFVLYRLSVGVSEVPEWDVNLTKASLDVEEYLGVLSSHLQSIRLDTAVLPKSLFTMMPEIIASVETSYATAMVNSALIVDTRHPHQPFSDRPALSVRGRHRCPGMRNLRQSANQSSTEQSTLQTAVSAEIQIIENEIFWRDLLVTGTFSVNSYCITN
ncbi:uncharacterized protein N7482_006736, partial [Penicillium canariense]